MKALIFVTVFLLSANTLAQEQTPIVPKQPAIKAVKAENGIKIDGKLDDKDWKIANPIEYFVQVEPDQGNKPKFRTIVKVLYDKKYLYISAQCLDSLGKKGVRVQDFRRDFDFFENDIFGIALDTYNQQRNAMAFQTNPYGAQRDLQVFDDTVFDQEWDALWQTRSNITNEGWTCEIGIPWKTLRYPKIKNDSITWGINLLRVARRENETNAYPGFPRSFDTYRMNYAVSLNGIEPPTQRTNIQVNPYLISQYDTKKGTGIATENDFSNKIGGELKWSPNAESSLDLTFNTDFAQADADRQVNNLTRFSIFFPERRQFFLENAGLFAAGNQFMYIPFFSRKIGLDNDGNPIPIDFGTRFTQKTKSYNLGAMYVHQRETETTAASNNTVLLFKKNYGNQNNIGLLLTNKIDETYQDLKTNSNSTATITGFWRISEKWSYSYNASASTSNGEKKDDGYAGNTSISYNSNDMGLLWNTGIVSKDYNPELGFLARNDFIKNYIDFYLNKRKLSWFPKFIRSWEPGFSLDVFQNIDNLRLQEVYFGFYPIFLKFNDGSKIVTTYQYNYQSLTQNFSPLNIEIAAGNYTYHALSFSYSSDQSSKLSFTTDFTFGGYYNGTIVAYNTGIRYAPIPQFAVSLNYEENQIKNLGVNQENLTTKLVTPNIRMALNPRLQLNVFYQYNSANERSRWNSRLSWEYQPQSFVYLVFNENKINDFKQDQTIAKISYLKQF